jgi:alanine racemase
VEMIDSEPNLHLGSVWTHLSSADEPDLPHTEHQMNAYRKVIEAVRRSRKGEFVCHAANSAAAFCHPAARLDCVRTGISLYGVPPTTKLRATSAFDRIRPVLTLKAAVSMVKVVSAGEGLGYGLRGRIDYDSVIATVSIGYADGVPRALFARGAHVLLRGQRFPIIGTITMDQLMIDCGPPTNLMPEVGDSVVLLGAQGDNVIGANDWADLLDTVPHEILSRIGPRVTRVYQQSGMKSAGLFSKAWPMWS